MNVTGSGKTEFYNDTDKETVLNVDWSHHGRHQIQRIGSVHPPVDTRSLAKAFTFTAKTESLVQG